MTYFVVWDAGKGLIKRHYSIYKVGQFFVLCPTSDSVGCWEPEVLFLHLSSLAKIQHVFFFCDATSCIGAIRS